MSDPEDWSSGRRLWIPSPHSAPSMKLTPLKVRGKRGQSKTAKKASSASAQGKSRTQGNEAADMTVVSETKRPKSRHGKDSDDAGGMLKKHLPRLSQLPQEMLERVFIASKNLSLPLVNRDLYRRLSNNSIKKQLVGAAFGPTWDAWYGLDGIEVSSYDGWISDAERVAGDSDFQASLTRFTPLCVKVLCIYGG